MQIDLNGKWHITADLGQQARAARPGYEPEGWSEAAVPGHWQQAPGLEHHTGAVLYRRSFTFDRDLQPGEIARLCFDGIFYTAKIWMNGAFVGEQTGYFLPHRHDVTRHLRRGENVVMVEVEAPPEQDPDSRRQITGVFGGWVSKPPGLEPGGIWRGVCLEVLPAVAPERFTLRATPDQLPPAPGTSGDEPGDLPPRTEGPLTATAHFDLEFAAGEEGALTWTATVTPETFDGEPVTLSGTQRVHRGWNRLEAALTIPDARLWWTWDQGRPDLYRLRLELRHGDRAPVSISRIFGIRLLDIRNLQLYLNGRRLFLRGTNYGPADFRIAGVGREEYRRDLTLMREANMNALRVHGHVAGPELYEEASRQGLLVWQDFPLHGLYARSVAAEAVRQARGMVELLGHWPAIGLWCAHADPSRHGERQRGPLRRSLGVLTALSASWNRSSLAGAVQAAIRKADPTRPCLAHPGDGTTYWGWYTGKATELPRLMRTAPKTVRLVAEFGAQAFPNIESSRRFVRGEWPNINWSELAERYMLQPHILERHIPHAVATTFEQYVTATQNYQGHLHKFIIEHFRQRKYSPCGGIFQFQFTDGAPGVTFAITDHWREPKAAYRAVQQAFSPVHIMAKWPEPAYPPGAQITLPVFLVSDRPEPLRGIWRWRLEREETVLAHGQGEADIPPDGLVTVPTGVVWQVPESPEPGEVTLHLALEADGLPPVANRYVFRILPPS